MSQTVAAERGIAESDIIRLFDARGGGNALK